MKCPNCQHEFEYQEGMNFCPSCGQPIQPQDVNPESNEIPPGKGPAPFEDRDHYDFLEGFLETLKQSLFNPVEFFRRLNPKGDGFMPLLYAVILIFFVNLLGILIAKILGIQDMWIEIVKQYTGGQFPYDQSFMTRSIIAQLLMLPFLQLIILIIAAGIMHLFVMLVGANKNGFLATLRVVGYTESASVFQLIPFVGGLISLIYFIVLYIIGLREIHETSTGKAAAAVFLPLILCCACVVMLFIMVLIPALGQLTNM